MVEHYLDMVVVGGSIPLAPTNDFYDFYSEHLLHRSAFFMLDYRWFGWKRHKFSNKAVLKSRLNRNRLISHELPTPHFLTIIRHH